MAAPEATAAVAPAAPGAGGLSFAAEAQKCGKCHEDEYAAFRDNLHFGVFAKTGVEKACAACHGDNGAEHAKLKTKESIVSFTKGSAQTPAQQAAQCLNCHKNEPKVAHWNSGPHNRADLSCASCHTNHKGRMHVKPSPEHCLDCHKDIAQLVKKRSHHPILEGKVGCKDCHNPHGSLSEKSWVETNVNLLCTKCHGDKRGPFMWQHQPVEENCLNCHNPHGSNHNRLLVEKVPNLCQECHQASGHVSTAYDSNNGFDGTGSMRNRFVGRACLNCHTKVHGSNAPSNFSGRGNSGKRFLR
ncbi:MAG: DmsE family decaheme c-type cytochrome [Oligoflexia bacterium]|nr:DmsE family decaheme c-type cytochrome [Oligoflexia bacterium]